MFALTFLWPLSACHVFESVQVECTSDMPCAKAADADTDVDADTDADSDTDPGGDPTLGWTVSLVGGTNGRVRVYDPVDRDIVAEWSGFGTLGGAAYYDPATGNGLLIGNDAIVLLNADATATLLEGGISGESWDVSRLGKHGILAYQGGIFRFDAEDPVDPKELVPAGEFGSIAFVGGNDTIAYFADTADGGPDLWQISTNGDYELLAEDYDTSSTRAVNLFAGPDDDPYGCSTAGAVYSIYALIDGDRTPYTFYDGDLTDVEQCDWDQGSREFLLYSPTSGIFRVDRYGKADQVYSPPNGYTLHRAYFWELPG